MDRLVGPRGERIAGPDLVRAQAQAVRQEIAMGRMALRVLAVLLSEMPRRRTRIRPARFQRMMDKYPGSFVRFGETEDGLTVRLLTPEEATAEMAPEPETKEASA